MQGYCEDDGGPRLDERYVAAFLTVHGPPETAERFDCICSRAVAWELGHKLGGDFDLDFADLSRLSCQR